MALFSVQNLSVVCSSRLCAFLELQMDLLLDEIAYLFIKVKANLISFGSSRFFKLHTKKIKYSVGIIFVVVKLNYTSTFP